MESGSVVSGAWRRGQWWQRRPLALSAAVEFLTAVRRFRLIVVEGGFLLRLFFVCGRLDSLAAFHPVVIS